MSRKTRSGSRGLEASIRGTNDYKASVYLRLDYSVEATSRDEARELFKRWVKSSTRQKSRLPVKHLYTEEIKVTVVRVKD